LTTRKHFDKHTKKIALDKLNKINMGICLAPTQPHWAALGAKSKVRYPGIYQ
jgi:hypothetical protein